MAGRMPVWATVTAQFLSENIHTGTDRDGWVHDYSTAYQIGCMALIALGYADERDWGAVAKAQPTIPNPFPRWDDICIAVVSLAEQRNLLAFHLPDGRVPPTQLVGGFYILQKGAPEPPVPNITAAYGLGPAHCEGKVLQVLERLGLVKRGSWTAQSEFVLWRMNPKNWGLDFASDDRFKAAIQRTIETIPNDVTAEIQKLLTINEHDISELIDWHAKELNGQRKRYGPKARLDDIPTREQAKRSLELYRSSALDWVFFRRWRMGDGWLSKKDATRALEVFHDRLAISMRKSVIAKMYPDRTEFFT